MIKKIKKLTENRFFTASRCVWWFKTRTVALRWNMLMLTLTTTRNDYWTVFAAVFFVGGKKKPTTTCVWASNNKQEYIVWKMIHRFPVVCLSTFCLARVLNWLCCWRKTNKQKKTVDNDGERFSPITCFFGDVIYQFMFRQVWIEMPVVV